MGTLCDWFSVLIVLCVVDLWSVSTVYACWVFFMSKLCDHQVALELQQRERERETNSDLDHELHRELVAMEAMVNGEKKLVIHSAAEILPN